MSRVPETFPARLASALEWAALDERRLLERARLFRAEIEQLLAGHLSPDAPLGRAAAHELAELLGVGEGWLAEGRTSVAARRLVYALELIDLGGRSATTGTVVVPSADYARILARAASVPGALAFDDTCERHPCGPTGSSGERGIEHRRGVTEA